MSTLHSSSTTAVANVCGCCQHSNAKGEQYCASCGQSLVESCAKCERQVTLTQKFCGSCGCDLEGVLRERFEQSGRWMTEAIESAKSHQFDRAISLLRRVADINDYRFAKESKDAEAAIQKVLSLQSRTTANARERCEKAAIAFGKNDRVAVINLLSELPVQLLDAESSRILKSSQIFLKEVAAADEEMRAAVAEKNWILAGGLVSQLLEMVPEHPKYRRLAQDLTRKLVANAERYAANSRYAAALKSLSAIPTVCNDESSQRFREKIENISWLANQFDDEPFATPLLGRLCVRLTKESPDDDDAKSMVKELSKQVRARPTDPRAALADWRGSKRCWIGGEAKILAYPQSIKADSQALDRNALARHSIAYGLALQGLGIARVRGDFAPTKKGLLSTIRGRKKLKSCWGVDVGSAGIRAVHLQLTVDGDVELLSTYFSEFAEPACRVGSNTKDGLIREELQTFAQQAEVGDVPVWANLPSTQTVTRFVRLPPVEKKQAETLLDIEARDRIPLAPDDLNLVRWMADEVVEETNGRPAFVSAARRQSIEQRIDLFRSAGITVTGLQSNSIALVNFAAFEFAEHWQPHHENDEPTAMAMIDCGAETMTFAVVGRHDFWFSSIDNAGENLTIALARSTKSNSSDAETLKRDPSKVSSPAAAWSPIETRLSELRMRIEPMYTEADRFLLDAKIRGTWCVGGGCFAFGWVRHVLQKK